MVCPAGMERGGEDELPVSRVFKHVGDSLTVWGVVYVPSKFLFTFSILVILTIGSVML